MSYGDWTLDTNTPTWRLIFQHAKITSYGATVFDISHGITDESVDDADIVFQKLVDLIASDPDFEILLATKTAPSVQQVTPTEVPDGD
ncbi:hypothetical protein RVR_5837 [Actinacidiphila reveromycinica]|uniref:Uncharacterized protein n=1 Tax=Actinacidiphila reveromycinica TaxID=659352 RepID=A0A7U3UVB6_9ACTN|nr:hypothetical protein [Streptomyces sp. SN-593]BBA99286.1 hypothetical protein RVR_5837 [Streptomyces sp. SN-593]